MKRLMKLIIYLVPPTKSLY